MSDPGQKSESLRGGRTMFDGLEGTTLGEYTLVESVARGGMAMVYRAVDPQGQVAAIKVMHQWHDRMVQVEMQFRFTGEAALAAMLSTFPNFPGFVRKGKAGSPEQPLLYLVLEFLQGQTLHRAIKAHHPFPASCAVVIARQIATALACLHTRQIIHADLTPSNVFLANTADKGPIVKVIDFGLSYVEGSHRLTPPKGQRGPSVKAPELCQLRDDGNYPRAQRQSDVYTLGQILFELITGKQCPKDPRLLSFHFAGCTASFPSAFIELAKQCLASDPDQRPNAPAVLQELLRLQGKLSEKELRIPDQYCSTPNLEEERPTCPDFRPG